MPARVMRDVYAIVVVTELVEIASTGGDVVVVDSEYVADSVGITGVGVVVVSGELGAAASVVVESQ